MKRNAARLIALMLTLTMVIGMTPVWAVPPQESGPVILGGNGITLPEGTEGTFLAFAANSVVDNTPSAMWEVEETGLYALTVYRAGDLSDTTEVDLRTVDASALYGEDYRIEDSRYQTEVHTTDGTILQQYGNDEDALLQGEETMTALAGQIENAREDSQNTEQAVSADGISFEEGASQADADDSAETGEKQVPEVDEPETAEAPATEEPVSGDDPAGDNGKSELARIKEEQTGLPSRETHDTEFLPLDESLISYLMPDLGSIVETSSSTTLIFEPEETEKTVFFRILDDSISEGDEIISFSLSEPEGGTVFTPSVMSVNIRDDEPVEHSLVTFTDTEYRAEDGNVTVTVSRSGAEYSFVTAGIRSLEGGSAAEGTNYAKVDNILKFNPNSNQATLQIPVSAAPGEEVSFQLELYDLKGGEAGAIMTATAVIPAGPPEESMAEETTAEEGDALLMADPSRLTIPGFGVENYALEKKSDGIYRIIDKTKKPAQEVGLYIQPTDKNGEKGTFGDSASERTNKWKSDKQYRVMSYYHWYAGNYGGTKFTHYLYNRQNYQQIYLDYDTEGKYDGDRAGFFFTVRGSGYKTLEEVDYHTGGRVAREVRGGKAMYLDYTDKNRNSKVNHQSGKLVPSAWFDDAWDNAIGLTAYCERAAYGCIEPDIYVYGYVALYRQYHVSVEQPDALPYIDVDENGNACIKNKQPANSFLGEGHNIRYPYQQISITDKATEQGGDIKGTLQGYYIKPDGTDGIGVFVSGSKSVIDLNDSLMRKLDEYAREHRTGAVIQKGEGNNYYMGLSIKPVYSRSYLTVKIGKSDDGRFSWDLLDVSDPSKLRTLINQKAYEMKNLGIFFQRESPVSVDNETGTIRGFFAVGDRLNLDAVPDEEELHYTSCHYEGFHNPDDNKAEVNMELNQHEQAESWKQLTLRYSRTELKPNFTRDANCIEIKFENHADQYFYLSPLATDEEKAGKVPDKQVLQIADSLSEDKVTPVMGKAYTLQAMENPQMNDGTIRPVFKLSDGTIVKGWVVDVIAKHTASQNVITVSWEKYNPASEKWYSLEGLVQYESVTVRQSSQAMKNDPAKDVLITAGSDIVSRYDKQGRPGLTVIRQNAQTDENGRFVIDGIRAVPGDKISLLADDNGVAQVDYRKLPEKGILEKRSFQRQQMNEKKKTNEPVTLTEECIVVDLSADSGDSKAGPLGMPVITGYTPYISDVRFFLEDHVADTRDNSVPIYAGDSVTVEADVSLPKLGNRYAELKGVRFIVYDKDNQLKDTWTTTRREDMNTWSVTVPYTPPDESPFAELSDGDQVYVQVIGPDRPMTVTYTDPEDPEKVIGKETFTVETPYALLNTGLSFYTPVMDEVPQFYEINQENLGTVDLLGNLSSKINTGNLVFEKDYKDPNHRETSNYTLYVGLGAEGSDGNLKNKKKMDELMKGGKEGKQAEEDFETKWNARQDSTNHMLAQIEAYNAIDSDQSMSDEEKAKAKEAYDKGEKRSYLNGLKRKSLNEFGKDNAKVSVEIKAVMAWEFVYDPESNSHRAWGFGTYLAAAGSADRTFYYVYVIPFYLNLSAKISASYEGGMALKAQELYAEEFAKKNNLKEYDSSDYGWITFGVDGKISIGAGIYGIIGARGIVKFEFLGTFSVAEKGWDPSGGVKFTMGGGFAVDLGLTSLEMTFDMPSWTTGYYNPGTKPVKKVPVEDTDKDKGNSSDNQAETAQLMSSGSLSLKAPDSGTETYNAIESRSGFNSILKPKREETIIDGAMKYVRPQAVALDDDTFLFLFLQNKEGMETDNGGTRTEENAATLVYAVADVTPDNALHWDSATGTVVLDNDGTADSTPDVLRIGNSVYVAWASAEAADVETVAGVKTSLSGSEIRLQKLDILTSDGQASGVEKSGDPVEVTADGFQDSHPQLVEENGTLAVYYLKQDLNRVQDASDLLNLTGNYNTWARRQFDWNLQPQEQSGNGTLLDDRSELMIRLPDDVMTSNLTVAGYTDAEGQQYRLTAWTVDDDGDIQSGEDQTLWMQVSNLTERRDYHPLKIDHGALANMQMNQVKIKSRNNSGTDEVKEDVFLTWVGDATNFRTLSINGLFEGLRSEGDSLEAIRGLTPEEITASDWPLRAFENAGSDPETLITLRNLSQGEPMYEAAEFGETVASEEDTVNQGSSLTDYILISGNDGNTYLAWTAAGTTGNPGSEVWMSSYFVISQDVWDRYNQAADGEEGIRPTELPAAGWSKPVQVTDFRLSMTDADRARYDTLMEKERTAEETEEMNALSANYCRGIDELAAVVCQDSGAMMLANTYNCGYSREEGYTENRFRLSAIRCVPDTSLEISDLRLSKDAPLPGETVQVTVTLKNTGLLPATDYVITAKDSKDTLFTEDYSQAADTVYADGENTLTFDWTVPDFGLLQNTTLTVSVTEKNPANGREDFETTNSVSKTLSRQGILTMRTPYGMPSDEYAREASLAGTMYFKGTDTEESPEKAVESQAADEYQALLSYYGGTEQIIEAVKNASDPDTTEKTRSFFVFVPVENTGNESLKDLNFRVNNKDKQREMGTASLKVLEAGESVLVPVQILIRGSELDDLGITTVNVSVTDNAGTELENHLINIQVMENMSLTIIAEGDNADKLQVLDMTTEQQLLSLFSGNTAKENGNKKNNNDPMNRAKRIDLKVGESIQLDTEAFPHNNLKKVDFRDMTRELVLTNVQKNPDDIVSVTSDGRITALSPGISKVTAIDTRTDGELKDVVLVYVTDQNSSGDSGGGSSPAFNVVLPGTISNGTAEASASRAKAGETVTITVKPEEGYRTETVNITDENGTPVEVADNGDGTWSFTMPASGVRIDPVFVKEDGSSGSVCPRDDTCPMTLFTDADKQAWYHDGVHWSLEKGIMNGTGENTFEPLIATSRAMIVTMLWRMEGSPKVKEKVTFKDVPDDLWYTDAVKWAAANGIVNGYSKDTFCPVDNVTREQIVTILYRYAQFKGIAISSGETAYLNDYTDARDISDWAVKAFRWAVNIGIIQGVSDTILSPKTDAVRAQVATMMMRFDKLLLQN